jgi:hypothetical protein
MPAPAAPGTPTEGTTVPAWTPPVAPPPSQWHPPIGLPAGFQPSGGGRFLEFVPTLSLSEQWTDNFNQTVSNKVTNYRSVVGPGGTVLINGATTKGFVTGNAGFTYDSAPASSNYDIFPTVTAGLSQFFSPRLSLTLTDSYTRNNSPSQADQFGLNTQRQTYAQNTFSASVNYLIDQIATQTYYTNSSNSIGSGNSSSTTSNIFGITASTRVATFNTVSVGYSYSRTETSGTSSTTVFGTTSNGTPGTTTGNLFTASVSRQTGTYSSVGLSGSYQLLSTPQQSGSTSTGDETIWNVSTFSTYGLPSGLSLSSSLGYSQVNQPNQPSTGGVTSNSNLSYGFGRAVVAAGIFSDFRQTGLTGQNFGVVQTTGVTGSLGYSFTPLVHGSVQANYFHNSPTGSGNNASSQSQSTFSTSANVSWALLRWLSLNGNYTYSLLSDPANGSLTGSGAIPVNTITLTLGIGLGSY